MERNLLEVLDLLEDIVVYLQGKEAAAKEGGEGWDETYLADTREKISVLYGKIY